MAVFRRAQHDDYFVSRRNWMQDGRIKNGAVGLLARMLSMPQSWEFNQEWLVKNGQDGKSAIRAQLMQLVKFGYVIRQPQERNLDGSFSVAVYHVYDYPIHKDPLTDRLVEQIFSNHPDWEEIQKILPVSDFPPPGNMTTENLSSSPSRNPDFPTYNIRSITSTTTEEAENLPERDNKGLFSSHEEEDAHIPIYFETVAMPDRLKLKLVKAYGESDLRNAVSILLRQKVKVHNPYGWLIKCMMEGFEMEPTKEEEELAKLAVLRKQREEIDKRKLFVCEELSKYPTVRSIISDYGFQVSIMPGKVHNIGYLDDDFEEQTRNLLKKIGETRDLV